MSMLINASDIVGSLKHSFPATLFRVETIAWSVPPGMDCDGAYQALSHL